MTPREFQLLDGKLRRTCYAVVFEDLVRKIDTLDKKQIDKLIKGIRSALHDAVEDSMDYLVEHKII